MRAPPSWAPGARPDTGRRPAGVVREPGGELGAEGRIVPRLLVGALELEDQRHQGLGDEAAAVDAEPAAGPAVGVGQGHGQELEAGGCATGPGPASERARGRGSAGSWPGPSARAALDPGRHVDGGRAAQRDRGFEVVDRQAAGEQPRSRHPQVLEQAPVEREAVAAGQASGPWAAAHRTGACRRPRHSWQPAPGHRPRPPAAP